MDFIDEVRITVSSGNGGDGIVSFLREKFKPRGGPAGGDGGRGGDVIIEVDHLKKTLIDYRYKRRFNAESGKPGQKNNKSGKSGNDLIIPVPVGTVIKDENGKIIVDLVKNRDKFLLARGGRGGKGNARFKSSTNQAPRICQKGREGEEKIITLELKLLADVGIIGLPNAGKSTLISRISKARPKIADYPFTTTSPNICVVTNDELDSFVVADIPGLIEGAHLGAGLGIKFLRHIERTKILVHLIDVYNKKVDDIKKDEKTVQNELIKYSDKLANKKRIIVFSKIDLIDKESCEKLKKQARKIYPNCLFISSHTSSGIKELKNLLFDIVKSEKM